MHYCDHALSVVRPSVRPSLTFRIFDFSSETTEQNSTKLDRKQELNILYQVCVFRADRIKQDGCPGLWFAETFSTSPLKPLNGIQRNLTGRKISTSSTKFVFFGPIGKTRWPPWPLIGWDIFDFSSETAEGNSTKLDRNQDFNVLYQVCVFRVDWKNTMAALASVWLIHFRLLLWKPLNRVQWNLTGSKISTSSTKFAFFGPIGKTRCIGRPGLWLAALFVDFSSETAEGNSTKLDRKQDLNICYQVSVFQADRKNKIAALFSDWLRHFRLLLWNRWTEFNKTWQEARFQRLLPSLCFSGRIQKQDGRPGLCLAETFSTSPLKPLNGIQRNSIGSKISTSSTKFFCFSGWSVNKNVCLGRFLKKVVHCTQMHDMWPFGPLVCFCFCFLFICYYFFFFFLHVKSWSKIIEKIEQRVIFNVANYSVNV